MPIFAFFAKKDILAGEEFTIFYGNTNSQAPSNSQTKCHCGTQNCLKFLPFDNL
jgi:SET domain-containing protein